MRPVKVSTEVIAEALWLLLIEAVPGLAGWGVLAVVVGGTVAAVLAEPVIVRLVWWARPPSTPMRVPGEAQALIVAGLGGPLGRPSLAL
jgi:hypothetical protein